ncbi:MAG TPA: HAD-IA family hydrolase [Blastocatellia bacterium]
MTANAQTIIFDFDYTLADSSRGAVDCINYALAQMSLPLAGYDLACSTIGLSLEDTFTAITRGSDVTSATRFSKLFVERAEVTMAELTFLFDFVPPVISELKKKGFVLGIVSTKYQRRIRSILARDRLLDHFDVIVGGEDVTRHKPHPEGLFKALETLNRDPATGFYVGDSIVDGAVAERAGMPFIAVLSGTTRRDAFDGLPVAKVIDSVAHLPTALSDLSS